MKRRSQISVLWGLALGMPMLLVVAAGELFRSLTERQGGYEADTLLWQVGLTALPFVVLALLATLAAKASRAWLAAGIAGAVMACALWGTYYVNGYRYWRDHLAAGKQPGGGVDFGVVFLMLFSPVLVGLTMAAAHRFITVRQGPVTRG